MGLNVLPGLWLSVEVPVGVTDPGLGVWNGEAVDVRVGEDVAVCVAVGFFEAVVESVRVRLGGDGSKVAVVPVLVRDRDAGDGVGLAESEAERLRESVTNKEKV